MIRVNGLGKRYRLGETHAQSLRDLINTAAGRFLGQRNDPAEKRSPGPSANPHRGRHDADFWALQDVSFDVPPGEVVGIIGRNGAGKSTLLKILSSIVTPTTGRVELCGRVASLLEVGTGFHPELTGRENVFLNGTILGMTRADVRRRFDEIVAFAGVEPFIDTPVKRYSSGMTVRLAFAVAAYLESEILIIDEVLAVGDMEFQRKCLGRMQAVSASGRTVLFVSHNMPSVRALTRRSVVLSQGQVLFDGPTDEAIDYYTQENITRRAAIIDVSALERPFSGLTEELRIVSLEVEQSAAYIEGERAVIRVGISGRVTVDDFLVGLTIVRHDESPVGNTFSPPIPAPAPGQSQMIRLCLPTGQLAPGRYHCSISLGETRSYSRHLYDSLADVLYFTVEPGPLRSQGWPDGWGAMRFDEMKVLDENRV